MGSKEDEYKEMFLAEALDNYEELNTLFTKLEKNTSNKKVVNHIFRITHTLKGNAMGMGFEAITELSHVMEDIFSEVKEDNIKLDEDLFNSLFKANDKLGELITAIKTAEKVNYKGIRTKLTVFLKNSREEQVHKSIAQEDINEKDIENEEVINKEDLLDDEVEEDSIKEASNLSDIIEEEVVKEEEQVAEAISELIEAKEAKEAKEAFEEEDEQEETKIAFSDLVQVPVRKLDSLLNLVGELIIERDSLMAASAEIGNGTNMFARLQRITSDLQYGVMDVRLVQVGFLFNKFHRIIRDVAAIENKQVNLVLEGTENEIDRNILKIMSDSLVHLIRNSVSHGIESAEERIKKGKPEAGKVVLRARNEKDTVIIEVVDDGYGIDAKVIGQKAVEKGIITEDYFKKASDDELIMMIFEPGFSNADQVTEVSGRGVGMDVVKRATESIGGNLSVSTELDFGTTIKLSLPSSMAVKGALLFELNQQEYAVALSYTEAVVSFTKSDIHKVSNGLMASYLGETISIIFLNDLYDIDGLKDLSEKSTLHNTFDQTEPSEKLDVLVASYGNRYVGFVVDKLLQQKEIVEKTLAPPIDQLDMISGATILGNGNVCLVLDIANIINTLFKEKTLI
jgi:two-component system chemotaxis sensor kinase CheA